MGVKRERERERLLVEVGNGVNIIWCWEMGKM